MKVRILCDRYPSTLETKINEFICDKRVDNIEMTQGAYELIATVVYEDTDI